MKLGMVMLAAGNSRRFDGNKLLFEIHGKPMYQWGLEHLCKAGQRLQKLCPKLETRLFVVTQYEQIVEAAEACGALVLRNTEPEKGISFSMQLGLGAARGTDACLFTVADQPWMTQKTMEELILKFLHSGKGLGCAAYGEQLGNPCIFSEKYYPELLALEGDRGGKQILLTHLEDTEILSLKNPRELADVDRREEIRE